jgi:hypothetical protein
VVSFDIYPVTHRHDDVRGKLEFVGRGVQRLVGWTKGKKPVWACIETGHVDNADVRPTPEQVRTEVWMAIACGASGIVYFAHEFAPAFVEEGLLAHREIAAGVREVDAEILAAAPALHGKPADAMVAVATKGAFAVRAHEHDGALWLFTASLQAEPQQVTFTVRGATKGIVRVGGEDEGRKLTDAKFRDDVAGYAIRHYRIPR